MSCVLSVHFTSQLPFYCPCSLRLNNCSKQTTRFLRVCIKRNTPVNSKQPAATSWEGGREGVLTCANNLQELREINCVSFCDWGNLFQGWVHTARPQCSLERGAAQLAFIACVKVENLQIDVCNTVVYIICKNRRKGFEGWAIFIFLKLPKEHRNWSSMRPQGGRNLHVVDDVHVCTTAGWSRRNKTTRKAPTLFL